MFNIIVIFLCVVWIVIQRINGTKWNTAVQVQNIVWALAFFVYFIGYIDYYPLRWDVYLMSMMYIFSFNMGALGTVCTYDKEHLDFENKTLYCSLTDKRKITICTLASVVCWGVAAVQILRKTVPFLTRNGLAVGMNLLRYNLYGKSSVLSTVDMLLIDYLIRPVFIVTIILMAMQIAMQIVNVKVLVVAIVDALMLVLMTAGRTMMVSFVLYIILALITLNATRVTAFILKYRRYLVLLGGVFAVFVMISANRVNRDSGIVYEVVLYYFSGLPFFSAILNYGSVRPFSLLGRGFLSPLIDPIVLGLRALGISVAGASQYISTTTQNSLPIGHGLATNATASTLLTFYLDFGWLGPVIFGIIWGIIVKKVYKQFRKNATAVTFAMYLFVFNGILSSIQNYAFIGVSTMMVIILILLLLQDSSKRIIRIRIK